MIAKIFNIYDIKNPAIKYIAGSDFILSGS